MTEDWFIDPADGLPYDFQEARVSGLSVGAPGTLATWESAARKWGTPVAGQPAAAGRPGGRPRLRRWTPPSASRWPTTPHAFGQFESTSDIYLPGGAPPAVGSVQRNPDLADTYRLIARQRHRRVLPRRGRPGTSSRTVQDPPVADEPDRRLGVPDPRRRHDACATSPDYRLRLPGADPKSDYRGLTVYGMSTPSSGGTAVGEALNILERTDLSEVAVDPGAAPVPGGDRAVLRRPQPVRRRVHPAAACWTS